MKYLPITLSLLLFIGCSKNNDVILNNHSDSSSSTSTYVPPDALELGTDAWFYTFTANQVTLNVQEFYASQYPYAVTFTAKDSSRTFTIQMNMSYVMAGVYALDTHPYICYIETPSGVLSNPYSGSGSYKDSSGTYNAVLDVSFLTLDNSHAAGNFMGNMTNTVTHANSGVYGSFYK